MKQEQGKKMILEQLKKVPVLEIACSKANVSKTTFYRWKTDDPEFAKQAEEALSGGKDLISDLAETQLIGAIKKGQLSALIFWLKSHRDEYRPRLEIDGKIKHIREEMTDEEFELFVETLKLAGYSAEKIIEQYKKHEDKN
jgi:hypothetical protein